MARSNPHSTPSHGSNPKGRVRWSDRWTVRSVARHVAGSHHAVALILADRPTADFKKAAAMPRVEAGDPAFPEWFAENTEQLLAQCRTVPPAATCWTPHPLIPGTAAYWKRRIVYDTLVHRWDAEVGAGISGAAMKPEVAADAVDELLAIGLRVTRAMTHAPAAPAVRLACTDRAREWDLDLSGVGRLAIHCEHIDPALTVRGTAEALLLALWGHIGIESASIEVGGDRSLLARWAQLLPTS